MLEELAPPCSHTGNGISSGLHNYYSCSPDGLGRAFSLQNVQMDMPAAVVPSSSRAKFILWKCSGETDPVRFKVSFLPARSLRRQHLNIPCMFTTL